MSTVNCRIVNYVWTEPANANALILTHIFGGRNSDGKCCKITEACTAK